ncbi:MAG: outer membrane lipoprotein-sorting protein [Desulfobacteraceae bacterium]|nr:MAG: outer membrane lipoprotein-sorting protein [Desulfobacteraceae bacterium]
MICKRMIVIFGCMLLLTSTAFALTGREIMEKNDALPEAKTAVSQVLMLIHQGSKVVEKEFEIKSKKYENDEDKTLITFTRPTQIKLLTHSHKDRDDDQWLRLSSGKIKRIASSDKGKSFVNSHFYYEDLTSRDIDKFDYTYIGDESLNGVDCYKVEGIKKKDRVYSKSVLYVRKSDFFVIRVDLHKKDEFHKYIEYFDIRPVSGILTAHQLVMSLSDGKGKTELKVNAVEYDKDINDSAFNKEAIR